MYIYTQYVCMDAYIYIYIYRERERYIYREREMSSGLQVLVPLDQPLRVRLPVPILNYFG